MMFGRGLFTPLFLSHGDIADTNQNLLIRLKVKTLIPKTIF